MRTLITLKGANGGPTAHLAKQIKNAIVYNSEEYSSLSSLLRIIRLDAKLFTHDVKESFVVVLRDNDDRAEEYVNEFCRKFDFTHVKMSVC